MSRETAAAIDALERRIQNGEGEFAGDQGVWELALSGEPGAPALTLGIRGFWYCLQAGRYRATFPRDYEWYWSEERLGLRSDLAAEKRFPSPEDAAAALCDHLTAAGWPQLAAAIRSGAIYAEDWEFFLEHP